MISKKKHKIMNYFQLKVLPFNPIVGITAFFCYKSL
jgi:hypothetical protein